MIRLKSVVFPEPLGPSSPTIFPGSSVNEIFFNIGLPPKDFEIFLFEEIGFFLI